MQHASADGQSSVACGCIGCNPFEVLTAGCYACLSYPSLPNTNRRLVEPAGLLAPSQLPRCIFGAQSAQHRPGRPAAAHHGRRTVPRVPVGSGQMRAGMLWDRWQVVSSTKCTRDLRQHLDGQSAQPVFAGGQTASRSNPRCTPDQTARWVEPLPGWVALNWDLLNNWPLSCPSAWPCSRNATRLLAEDLLPFVAAVLHLRLQRR